MASINPSSATLLHRYLSGAITAPEEAELERRARTDEVLAEALRGLQSAPEEDHAARVKNMLAGARREVDSGATVTSLRPRRYRWAAAAAVLLLISASLFFLPDLLDSSAGDMAMQTEASPDPLARAETQAEVARDEAIAEATGMGPSSPAPGSSALDPRPRPAAPSPEPAAAKEAAVTQADARRVAEDQATARRAQEERMRSARQERTTTPPPAGRPAEPIMDEIAEAEAPPPAPVVASPAIVSPTSNAEDEAFSANRKVAPRMESLASGAAAPPAGRGDTLSGRVTSENGYPIVNALVRLPGLPLGERTDSNGIFQLPADATATVLDISHPDYESDRVDISTLKESLQISLERKDFQADYDRTRWIQNGASTRIILDNKPGYASPLEGYNSLRQRIEANRPADVPNGKVKLSFLVNPDGTLTDFQFRGRPDQATMDYIGTTLVTTSVWEVVQGEEPVRVYFKVVFE